MPEAASHFVFLVSSTRQGGNSECLAQQAAQLLPEGVRQTWLHPTNLPLEPFTDICHSVGVYLQPSSNQKVLLEAARTFYTSVAQAQMQPS